MKKKLIFMLTASLSLFTIACSSTTSTSTVNTSTEAVVESQSTESESTESIQEIKGTGITLTIYSNSVSDGRGDWLVERATQDGFSIQYVDAGGADVYSRLVAEAASPIADLSFGLTQVMWSSLKAQDLLEQYTPIWADEISEGLNDPDGYYHAIVKQAILLIYDKNQTSEEEAPKDWLDLWSKEAFQGKYEYSSGLGGATVRNVLSGILSRYIDEDGKLGISDEGWEEIRKYYEYGVPSQSGVDLYANISDTSNPIQFGQIWSSGIETRDEQYGTDTGIVIPEIGIPYLLEGIGIIKGTKNLEEAQRFVDWFGSAQIQGEWAEEFSTLPANVKAVDKANEFNQYIATLKAQDIDWSYVTENIDAWCEEIELNYMP